MSKMSLELLPNEILLNLFVYFNGSDLLHTFYGLNTRFNFLLYNQYRNYCFNFKSISKHNFIIICQQHLPFIVDRIISLNLIDSIETPEQINLFFSYTSSVNQFIRLRSFSVTSFSFHGSLMKILDRCHYLYNLTHLNFHFYAIPQNKSNFQSIVDNIWSLPKLIQCNFHLCTKRKIFFTIPKKISLSIKNVCIYKNELKLNEINQLFDVTPCLKSLSVSIDFSFNFGYMPFTVLSLFHLNLHVYNEPDTLIMKFLQSMPNLYHLKINLRNSLIDGYQWKQIISNYLPNLKIFRLEMEGSLIFDQNIQELADELIKSFQTSFWINEHQWFVRCFIQRKTIYLSILSNTFDYDRYKLSRSFTLNDPYCDHHELYNGIPSIGETLFDQPIPTHIRVSDIEYLGINLPTNDQFWSSLSNFNRLKTLTILSHVDNFQSKIQALLDRAPNLYCLNIYQNISLPLQTSLFQSRHTSIRQLNLRECHYHLNEEECIRLCHSPLGIQCEVLSIRIKNRESIIYLVQNMINLLSLYVQCEDEKYYHRLILANNDNNDKYVVKKIGDEDELVRWLKDRLPSMCSISRDVHFDNDILICI
ncbi:unnamed protein product [Rotaria sordida]|uniref:F-box domain-containing protein n=1 Tax=Rotaria sordida TaxID=392033 RepID=A0A815BLG5_9BILA|nr:unnamed protein product [Rotaria sordida]CAF1379702.1 unnamed protein product [Rotaria sordida]CAF3782443.1 unnamed protein product [Rotaria sordida]CAF3824336.1 unnamed protein product [Rotaria sordida]